MYDCGGYGVCGGSYLEQEELLPELGSTHGGVVTLDTQSGYIYIPQLMYYSDTRNSNFSAIMYIASQT